MKYIKAKIRLQKVKIGQRCKTNVVSDFTKNGCIWHWLTMKEKAKSTKNMKISTFFVGIRGQNSQILANQ